MEGSLKDLALLRLERAEEMLTAAKKNYGQDELKTVLNRSYYAILHAMPYKNADVKMEKLLALFIDLKEIAEKKQGSDGTKDPLSALI